MTLRLSNDLKLPTDAATQTFAFIGRKSSGKSYGSGKLVELLIDSGVQVVVLDSVGNWYGLRLAANGKDPGIDIAILGGLRGDVPLEATGGALVADVIADSGRNLIVDISQFSKADRQRFATAFGERLWLRKKAEYDPTPVHLVIEESQLIVPERVDSGAARMVGIYEEIIRLGRNYGIGVTMITQRPQSVSKEVLNQTECLMVFQVNGAHERKALKEWILHQGMDTKLLAELPGLKAGNCYVWSPQWLDVLQRIKIAEKRTYDSTKTPKAGAKRHAQRQLKAIDLDDLTEKMAATIERAKADDPKELRRQIVQLERELAAAQKATPAPEHVEVSVFTDADRKIALDLRGRLGQVNERLRDIDDALSGISQMQTGPLGDRFTTFLLDIEKRLGATGQKAAAQRQTPRPPSVSKTPTASNGGPPTRLPDGERRTLIAIAQHRNGVDKVQLSILTGYKRSTRDAYLQRLRTKGLVVESAGAVFVTDEGIETLGPDYELLPTGDALRLYWMARLPEGERVVLGHLSEAYPSFVQKGDIDEATNYKRSTRDAYIQRLRAKRLIEERGTEVRAADLLFG